MGKHLIVAKILHIAHLEQKIRNNTFFVSLLFRFIFNFLPFSCACMYMNGMTSSIRSLHQLDVHLILLDEWAGDVQVNGHLVKTTATGRVKIKIKTLWTSFLETDRKETGSLGKLGGKVMISLI